MLCWSCKSARSFRALRTVRARHTDLLTPLECAVPRSILISILSARINPLESALTSHSQLIENTATLSPAECAVTSNSLANPLECALTKNTGGGGGRSSHPGAHHSPLITRHYTQVLSFHTLAHSFALFCTHQKLNSFVFKRFRTLCEKHPGVGVGVQLVD